MTAKKKAQRVGIVFIVLLLIGGIVLMYKGNDAIVLATERKEGILTAEQVKMSFDSVSGRLISCTVSEGDTVKKGDVIMQLDSTDTDLAIAKMKAQIAQMDAKIQSAEGTMGVNFAKASTSETQGHRQIDRQRAAVSSARATLKNAEVNYNRMVALKDAGAVSESQLDDASTNLEVAREAVTQQQQAFQNLLGGAQDSGDTDSIALPSVQNDRAAAANMGNDVDALKMQKEQLEVQLKELEVQKERLTLRAPEDGKVLKVLVKEGEMISPSTPVVLLETKTNYYDLYVSEEQANHIAEGQEITGETVSGKRVAGTVKLLTKAPGFADLKQSRERGQSDLTAFQVRIYVDKQDGVIPGMTIGVKDNEFRRK